MELGWPLFGGEGVCQDQRRLTSATTFFLHARRWAGMSLRRQDNVVLFTFAEEEMFGEEQILRNNGTLKVRLADVVQVHTAAFDVFSRLSF